MNTIDTDQTTITDERRRYSPSEQRMMRDIGITVVPSVPSSDIDENDTNAVIETIFANAAGNESIFAVHAAKSIWQLIHAQRAEIATDGIREIFDRHLIRTEEHRQGVTRILVQVTGNCNGLAQYVRDAFTKICSL